MRNSINMVTPATPQPTREKVRERPSMYFAGTSNRAVTNMALEVLGNAFDLVLSKRATSISITAHADRSIEIADDGPGIDLSEPDVQSFFERSHNRATADGHQPHIHLWSEGHGLFIVNALCEKLAVDSVHGEVRRIHEWTNGGDSHSVVSVDSSTSETGTSIRFWPDTEFFGTAALMPGVLMARVDELDQLMPEIASVEFNYRSPTKADGLLVMTSERTRYHDDPWRLTTSIGKAENSVEVDLALSTIHPNMPQGTGMAEQMQLFCNFQDIHVDSGVHRSIRAALGAPPETPVTGLVVVCSIRMLSPEFSGPTMGRVDDPIAMDAVAHAVRELLNAHPDAVKRIQQVLE